MNEGLWTFLERRAAQRSEKIALHYQNQRWSYADLVSGASRAAAALAGVGVRAGDRVCLMLGNSPDYVLIWFGLARLGAVTVPINVHARGEGLAYILRHSQATTLIVEDALFERVREAARFAPQLHSILRRGGDGGSDTWADLVIAATGSVAQAPVQPDQVSAILYTSGTTGAPKGVMLSHNAYLNSARYFAEVMVAATETDVLFTTLPLFHINAQAHTVLPAIYAGATMAIGERFSASNYWQEIAEQGATIFNTLAAMIPILMKQAPGEADRAHRARITACAATPKDLWRPFEERFGVAIVEGYGLTETTGFCVTNPLDAIRVGSIGRAMDFVELQIVDGEDRPLPAGQQGEIVLRAREPHTLMEGYYQMPTESTQAMRGGWFHTGDMGYCDTDGYAYFVDRIKQSIRRRGENISSWEVERAVNAHPAVLESAAVGVPSEMGEEEVKIVIVLRPQASLSPVDVVRWCEERLAYFAVPRYVEFTEALPKTATERVEKYKLKQAGVGSAWDREAASYTLRR
jgi:crotonobetaine/carnitine-CoA ligase